MTEEIYAEYETQICHRTHKVIKITLPNQSIKCLKIFNLRNEQKRIIFYKAHFEHVKDWFKQRYSGNSNLKALNEITVDLRLPKNTSVIEKLAYLKVKTNYIYHSLLSSFYIFTYQNPMKSDLAENEDTYMYYFLQLFQIIWRGGSIMNYMYIPQNMFISRPGMKYGCEIAKIYLNYTSTSGFPLLFFQQSIAKEQLEQIFPILPYNLFALMKDKNTYIKQLNRILKMKAFAWNMLCFILRYVPNILIQQTNLQPLISTSIVRSLIQKHLSPQTGIFIYFLTLPDVSEKIRKATQETGINLKGLFKKILIDNCQGIDWKQIYSEVFLQNKQAKQRQKRYKQLKSRISLTLENVQSVSQRILKWMWQNQNQNIKLFYQLRSIPPQSIIYFLIRSNVNFKSIMEHLNILQFIDQSISINQLGHNFPQFGDKITVHIQLMQDAIKNIDNDNFKKKPLPYSQKIPKIPQFKQSQILKRLNDPYSFSNQFSRKIQQSNGSYIATHHMGKTLRDLQQADISDFL